MFAFLLFHPWEWKAFNFLRKNVLFFRHQNKVSHPYVREFFISINFSVRKNIKKKVFLAVYGLTNRTLKATAVASSTIILHIVCRKAMSGARGEKSSKVYPLYAFSCACNLIATMFPHLLLFGCGSIKKKKFFFLSF